MKRIVLFLLIVFFLTAFLPSATPLQPNEKAITVSNLLNTKTGVEIKLQVVSGVATTVDERCFFSFESAIWSCSLGDMPTYFQKQSVVFSFEPDSSYTCLVFYKDPNSDTDIIQECT